jgi:hypothetical protein
MKPWCEFFKRNTLALAWIWFVCISVVFGVFWAHIKSKDKRLSPWILTLEISPYAQFSSSCDLRWPPFPYQEWTIIGMNITPWSNSPTYVLPRICFVGRFGKPFGLGFPQHKQTSTFSLLEGHHLTYFGGRKTISTYCSRLKTSSRTIFSTQESKYARFWSSIDLGPSTTYRMASPIDSSCGRPLHLSDNIW